MRPNLQNRKTNKQIKIETKKYNRNITTTNKKKKNKVPRNNNEKKKITQISTRKQIESKQTDSQNNTAQ